MKNGCAALLTLSIVLGTTACATDRIATTSVEAPVTSTVLVDQLLAGARCGGNDTGVKATVIETMAHLEQIYQDAPRAVPGGQSNAAIPVVDFKRSVVVWLTMGQRSTLGYRVTLAQHEARVSQGKAEIAVAWQEPASGMMVGQALTSPCLLLRLARADYQSVQFNDLNGQLRAAVNLP